MIWESEQTVPWEIATALPAMPVGSQGDTESPPGIGDSTELFASQTASSYFEIEVTPIRVSLFERSGDGKTAALLRLLRRYGLRLEEIVSSPCG